MNSVNGPGNPPSLNNRNLQGFPNSGPDMSRQLGLILAQNQQNQQNNNGAGGGPINFGSRQQQMQAMNQGSSPETHNLFPSQGMDRRPSPAHPLPLPNNLPSNPMGQSPLPQQQQPSGQGQSQQRRVTMAELNERVNNMRTVIMQQEVMLQHMGNQHRTAAASGNQADQSHLAKMRHLMVEIKGKKEYLARMIHMMSNNMYVFFFRFLVNWCRLIYIYL
jgi:hypothetical protein